MSTESCPLYPGIVLIVLQPYHGCLNCARFITFLLRACHILDKTAKNEQ